MGRLDVEEALLRAAMAAMRPYVRRMLQRGVTFGQVEARLRELFVEVAERDASRTERAPTDSRVSILTGINRKEVRRIRALDRDAAPRSFSRNLAAGLVSRWLSDPRTRDANGRPRPIPYEAPRGPSFVKLVSGMTADLHPRALLDVLIEAGAAVRGAGDLIALTRAAYIPQRGRSESLAMLADDPPELINTMLYNVLGEGDDARLQQKLAYDNIGSDGVQRVVAALRREAERFFKRADAILLRNDRDRNPRAAGGARTYAGIGMYYFEEPHAERQRLRSRDSRGGRTEKLK